MSLNPELKVVLALNSSGEIVGAALGNDVTLRDIEGRSALLLGECNDNKGSCAIGPFVRLFDDTFTLDSVRGASISLRVEGQDDDFVLEGVSHMTEISRDPWPTLLRRPAVPITVPAWLHAVPWHNVLADQGPRRGGLWLYAAPRRPGIHLDTPDRCARRYSTLLHGT